MKKIIISILVCTTFISTTNASSSEMYKNFYTNNEGVSMNELQYNNLNTIYGEDYASIITQERFNQLQDVINYEIYGSNKEYIKSKLHFDKYGNIIETDDKIISEETYLEEIFQPQMHSLCGMGQECWETEYKILNLSAIKKSTTKYEIISTLSWKKMPSVRSGDLIGLWFPTFSKNTYSGNYSYVEYKKNGNITKQNSNIYKTFDQIPETGGDRWANYARIYGHNLPSGNFDYLKIIQGVTLNDPTMSYQRIRSSYQHAVKSCSAQNSVNCVYNLSAASGSVGEFYGFNKECENNFDNMQGVHIFIN